MMTHIGFITLPALVQPTSLLAAEVATPVTAIAASESSPMPAASASLSPPSPSDSTPATPKSKLAEAGGVEVPLATAQVEERDADHHNLPPFDTTATSLTAVQAAPFSILTATSVAPATPESPAPIAREMSAAPAAAIARNPLQFVDTDDWQVQGTLQFGVNVAVEGNLYWDLAATFAPDTDFNADTQWLELYIKPGVNVTHTLSDAMTAYGRLSAVGSATLGTDSFDRGDTGRITLEEAHVGLRSTTTDPWNFDVSIGARELRLGTGMLIANGASSGFERGALKFGPRKAWEMAAIGRLIYQGDLTGTVFYLDPNELPANNTSTRLAGLDLRFDGENQTYIGLTYAHVLNSEAAYPQANVGAPPVITPGARDGLNLVNLYTRVTPFEGDLAPLFFTLEGAYEWNDRIDLSAWGGRAQVGYTFQDVPWSPTLTYTYQTFSGDDPATSQLERFDPLYYEGSPNSWATGSKSSAVFINTNVQAHQLALRLSPSPRDTVTLRYAHVRANELGSPLQFGQATRFDFAIGAVTPGVTNTHLSDDLFLEYNRILNPNLFLTAGASISFPGAGIRAVLDRSDTVWYGGFVNLVFNF